MIRSVALPAQWSMEMTTTAVFINTLTFRKCTNMLCEQNSANKHTQHRCPDGTFNLVDIYTYVLQTWPN